MNNDLQQVFGSDFDTNSVPPQEDFAVIPPSNLTCLIEKAEIKPTKKGDGLYISLQLSVIEECQFKGRKVFDNINIKNLNQQCVEIGLRSLSALGKALGLIKITDSMQLVNQIVVAHIKVKDDQNCIRTYSAVGQPAQLQQAYQQPQQYNTVPASQGAAYQPQAQYSPQPAQQPTQPIQQPQQTSNLPWMRK